MTACQFTTVYSGLVRNEIPTDEPKTNKALQNDNLEKNVNL